MSIGLKPATPSLTLWCALATLSLGCASTTAASTKPAGATESKATDGPAAALDSYRRAIVEYEAGSDPREVGAYFGSLMRTIDGLVALAKVYAPAATELDGRQAALQSEIAADPVHVPTRKIDIYMQLTRSRNKHRDIVVLLRSVTQRTPHATAVRRQLLLSALPYLQEHSGFADIYSNRDVLEESLRSDSELLQMYRERLARDSLILYESTLRAGNTAEAQQVAARLLQWSPGSETYASLIAAAERAGAPTELARLAEARRGANGDCNQPPRVDAP